ncbi:hypothetical protein ACLOJK_029765 [Asimina triloba]
MRRLHHALSPLPSKHVSQPQFLLGDPLISDLVLGTTISSKHSLFDTSAQRMEALKEEIRPMFHGIEALESMELIDDVQRLGIGHSFHKEMKEVLHTISVNDKSIAGIVDQDLHATALKFRLLRQHGYMISQDVFNSFRDNKGNFKQGIWTDIKGILSLYEASYLSLQGETVLDEAQAFAKKHLKDPKGKAADPNLQRLVEHALELPLHWRSPRPESRWYIETYERMGNTNPSILELAKLEFNMVQSMQQKELKDLARWWQKLGLQRRLSFSRDRIPESFLFSLCIVHGSQYGLSRYEVARISQLVTTIDDIYDVYGTLDELELFTDAVDRWDLQTIDELPDYMRLCFLALYNTANEAAYHALKEQGCNALPYIKKAWADLCKGYLVEAKWYESAHTPSVNVYLEHSWRTIGATIVLCYTYLLQGETVTKDGLYALENYADLIRDCSLIFRLNDDLVTSKVEMARGDASKSIRCYMREKGISESSAHEEVASVISETWKKMNEACLDCTTFSRYYIEAVMNVARSSHYMYEFGDNFGVPCKEMKDRLTKMLVQPIQL